MTAFRHVHRGILYDRSHLHRPICLSAFATSAWAAVAGHAVHLRRVSNFLQLTMAPSGPQARVFSLQSCKSRSLAGASQPTLITPLGSAILFYTPKKLGTK